MTCPACWVHCALTLNSNAPKKGIKRIRGQVDSIERSLTEVDDCADMLMLLANVRGGVNSLTAEILEDHIRLHMMGHEKSAMPSVELAEDLIGLVRG
jgi:DNA-binding FrmR family transcriptional regulator